MDSRALSGRQITQWEEAQTWSQTKGLRDSILGASGRREHSSPDMSIARPADYEWQKANHSNRVDVAKVF